MSLKQLLLLTSCLLLFTLQRATGLATQVKNAQQEVTEARELTLASEKYETQLMNITKYAPLSAGAIPGHDYAGDPSVTASGEKLVPGKTAAAGENIPFGTEIYVEGEGWYAVEDRGGNIGPNDIDLACKSKEESIEFGQKQLLVILKAP
ncbi:MAG TPA: hypothetical protein VFC74_01900 [Oscillospiraceae bacterium]|nr:hypothetical protein [Oscillospiraceae bacterium]